MGNGWNVITLVKFAHLQIMKKTRTFQAAEDSSTVLKALVNPVLFINIEPEFGERYQGIVPLDKPTLAGCLMQYYDLVCTDPDTYRLSK